MSISAIEGIPAAPAPHRAPRPWLAALLALVAGLGHLYTGRLRAALVVVVIELAVSPLLLVPMLSGGGAPWNVLLTMAAFVALKLAIIADAWRGARRVPRAWTTRPRLLLALAGAFVALMLLTELPARYFRNRYGEAFRIPGGAMAPTILPGEYVIAPPLRGVPRRGDVVAYVRDGSQYVHRVAGVPGDTLRMVDGVLYRDGARVAEPYARTLPPGSPGIAEPRVRTWGPFVVPSDAVFLLGDNRESSLDSRWTGPVPMADVFARPTRIYWSSDPEGGVRWGRIGTDVAHAP